MKRLSFLFVILILTTSFYSCNFINNESTSKSKDHSKESEKETLLEAPPNRDNSTESGTTNIIDNHEKIPYISHDIKKFIDEYAKANKETSNDALFTVQSTSDILIPLIVSNDFIFSYVEANEYNTIYYYLPTDYSKPYFDYNVGLVVTMSKESNSYNANIDKYKLDSTDGKAINFSTNEILMNNKGYLISISFPSNIQVENSNQLHEYFSFKTIENFKSQIKE